MPSQPAQRCAEYPRCGTRFKPFTARFVLPVVALRPACCARGCDCARPGAAAAQHLYRNPVFVGSAAASCSLLLAWGKHRRGFSPVASCGGTFFFFLFLFFQIYLCLMLSEQDGCFLKEILKPSEQENFDQLTRMETSSSNSSGAGKCWGGLGKGLGAPYS